MIFFVWAVKKSKKLKLSTKTGQISRNAFQNGRAM